MEDAENPLTPYLFVSSRRLKTFNSTKVRLKQSDRRIIRGFLHKDSLESVAVYERLYLSILGPRVDNKDPYVVFFELRSHSLEDYVLKNRVDWYLEINGRPNPSNNPDSHLDTILDITMKATLRTDLSRTLTKEETGVPFDVVSPQISGYSGGRWKTLNFSDPVNHMVWLCDQNSQSLTCDGFAGESTASDKRTMSEFVHNRLGELKAVIEGDDDENLATAKRLSSDSTLIDLEGLFELDLEWVKSQVAEIRKLADPEQANLAVAKIRSLLKTRQERLQHYIDIIALVAANDPDLQQGQLMAHFSREHSLLQELETASTEDVLSALQKLPNIGWTKCFYWFMFLNSKFSETRLEQLLDPDHLDMYEPELGPVMNSSWQRDEEVPKVVDALFDDLVVRWIKRITLQHNSILKTPLPLDQWAGNRIIVNREFSAWEMSGDFGVGISSGSITLVDVRERTSDHHAIGFVLRWYRNPDKHLDALKV